MNIRIESNYGYNINHNLEDRYMDLRECECMRKVCYD